MSMLDGISYGKGSSWLKQLFNLIGFETMSQGLHAYFKKYQWGNTTCDDFVQTLDGAWRESGDKSLGEDFCLVKWCKLWLNSSGINILEPVI